MGLLLTAKKVICTFRVSLFCFYILQYQHFAFPLLVNAWQGHWRLCQGGVWRKGLSCELWALSTSFTVGDSPRSRCIDFCIDISLARCLQHFLVKYTCGYRQWNPSPQDMSGSSHGFPSRSHSVYLEPQNSQCKWQTDPEDTQLSLEGVMSFIQ